MLLNVLPKHHLKKETLYLREFFNTGVTTFMSLGLFLC